MLARGIHLKDSGLEYSQSLIATYIEQLLFIHTGITIGSITWYLVTGNNLWFLLALTSILGIVLVPLLNGHMIRLGQSYSQRLANRKISSPRYTIPNNNQRLRLVVL